MQGDRRHIDGRHPREVEACVEQGESRRGSQLLRARAECVSERCVGRRLQTRNGGAGVNDDAPVAKRVELEGRRGDGEQVAAHADSRHLEIVEGCNLLQFQEFRSIKPQIRSQVILWYILHEAVPN